MYQIDGKIVEENLSEGILYGTGVFETILIKEKKFINLLAHYNRMKKSSKILDIDFTYSYEEFEKELTQYIKIVEKSTFSLRVTLLKNGKSSNLLLSHREYRYTKELYKRGFKITIGKVLKNPTSPLTYIKSCCYSDNLLSLKEAKNRNFDEVIHLNFNGELTEGSYTNLFFIKGDIIKTPKVSCGLLDGLMRQRVLKLVKGLSLKVEEGSYKVEELIDADSIFLTNSLMGIMPVSLIEEKEVKINKILKKLLMEELV